MHENLSRFHSLKHSPPHCESVTWIYWRHRVFQKEKYSPQKVLISATKRRHWYWSESLSVCSFLYQGPKSRSLYRGTQTGWEEIPAGKRTHRRSWPQTTYQLAISEGAIVPDFCPGATVKLKRTHTPGCRSCLALFKVNVLQFSLAFIHTSTHTYICWCGLYIYEGEGYI